MRDMHTHTRHSSARAQQRSVPPLIIDWLDQFGVEAHDGHGAVRRFFDRRARKRLASAVGSLVVERMNEYLDAYMVQSSEGRLITVGRRTQRQRRR